ncbi:hypothetical protein D9613_010772 [Agrocybe pediades]|uniref:Uncharacterized protein n=1 Tax=Agrocybe pediades TaxID=84607 RepID=A0A8H4QM55_9AGAR|nr:hypothetical protein D9613_010772 [Agrocybe pediades]
MGSSNVASPNRDEVKRKEPLRAACESFGLSPAKTDTLSRLRDILHEYWFKSTLNKAVHDRTPQSASAPTAPLQSNSITLHQHPPAPTVPALDLPPITVPAIPSSHEERFIDRDNEEALLVEQYGVPGAAAEEVLGYDSDEEEEEEAQDIAMDSAESDDDEAVDLSSPRKFDKFRKQVRVEEAKRAEGNRRKGGIKTQKSVVKAWEEFCAQALSKSEIKDTIIDEHHLLLFIRYSAHRPKRKPRGGELPGTRIGASQIKKLFFGALRIRKVQDAEDPKLHHTRPATTIHVWDSLKNRLNEAIERDRTGGGTVEDAPDIVANTFLEGIDDAQMAKVGIGFLMHRELRSAINAHLAWTCQNASGNRGDDFRALRLAELQEFEWMHPDGQTPVFCVLGCQGEEKAGASRGMRTKVNPVYSVYIAHKDPTLDPLISFSFLFNYLFDHCKIIEKYNMDFTLNKSWRQFRVLAVLIRMYAFSYISQAHLK